MLRQIIPPPQRRQLRQWAQKVGLWADQSAGSCVNILPAGLKVFLKSHLQVIGRMDYAKEEICLDVSSNMEQQVRLHSCAKEPETIAWMETFKPGEVFFDIGANVGAYTLVAAKYFKGQVAVYAFEPSFLNFAKLCRNIYLNQCSKAMAFNIAFAQKTEVSAFNYSSLTEGAALHALGEAKDDFDRPFTPVFKQEVLGYAMDDFISQFGLAVPQHIKIDVDGNEWQILQGASRTLADGRLKSLLIEIGQDDQRTVDFLKAKGFSLHQRHILGETGLANCIFTRGQ